MNTSKLSNDYFLMQNGCNCVLEEFCENRKFFVLFLFCKDVIFNTSYLFFVFNYVLTPNKFIK